MYDVLNFTSEDFGKDIEEVLDHLEKANEENRLENILKYLRHYWQKVLLNRRVCCDDEEMILVAGQKTSDNIRNLDETRKPCVVFIGANIDPLHRRENEEIIFRNNLSLARFQYGEDARLIAPLFTDGEYYWRPHLLHVKPQGRSTDVAVLHLLLLRELKKDDEYKSLRSRYHELAGRSLTQSR